MADQLLAAGPGVIEWDVDGPPVVFDTYLEDLMFKDEEQEIDIFEAQSGDTPVDSVSMGTLVEFEANITSTTLAMLSRLCIAGTLSGAGDDQLMFKNPVGDSKYQYAKKVHIKPIINGVVSTDPTQWLEVFKVIAKRAFEIPYGKGQRVYHVVFKTYPDRTSGNKGNIYQMGDAT